MTFNKILPTVSNAISLQKKNIFFDEVDQLIDSIMSFIHAFVYRLGFNLKLNDFNTVFQLSTHNTSDYLMIFSSLDMFIYLLRNLNPPVGCVCVFVCMF